MIYWKYSITLNTDSTFKNVLNAHMKNDTAFGQYSISADTVFFKYRLSNEDSTEAKFLIKDSITSLNRASLYLKSNFRDSIALIKNKSLLYKGFKLTQK